MSLAIIGFLGGLITGISPCILPVLPVIFLTGGAPPDRQGSGSSGTASAGGEVRTASRWRPYLVVLGLMTSFTLVTLLGSLILGALGLPQSIIRWVGIALLGFIGIGLLIPAFERLLEKPFTWLPRRDVSNRRNGFAVGLALGTVFVPCAGPVLAAIIVAGSTGQIGPEIVILTVSFAIGVSLPLLAFALAGRNVIDRIRGFRKRERAFRITAGVAMLALAVGLVFDVPAALQRLVPDYTAPLQRQLAEDEGVREALDLGGIVTDENRELSNCTNGAPELESCGTAPSIRGIDEWMNTAGGAAVDLEDLRGQVVLIDFWAYSCINCQRSIPHVVAWDEAYRDAGLQVIGVHSPEYAFEKDPRNVRSGAESFGITYPIALDNSLSTWTNYRNRYWPAHYLIDAEGTVRHIAFGEGNYAATEKLIRELLVDADPGVDLPGATGVQDATPTDRDRTPETFLGWTKIVNYAGAEPYRAGDQRFTLPEQQPRNSFALDGNWTIATQYVTPDGSPARIRLAYSASEVRIVLAGEGTITATVDGESQSIVVAGTPRSYELRNADRGTGTIEVELPPGVEAYSFTFG
ncbi:cytochrome c biogenesis protein DipZ [Microbacterium amylolyticum]|uniref:Cytochrome c biogenesis protein CcdA/thiol-disulfide isomerase/thioredoxin n=1 Tax=Microbacterium amylolyticum TaxID=936337 RepID=A0ABS4ZGZ6_9MICO|nr:cytochrome c biogenesis protein DipZ [Microbacterium amylolyticum]MBP2436555.1 cytochrome c biogenesis protein CcdA/thiol-disulfide isomerase/thioredoxin [Microbacterium amylolyticum]